MAQMLNFDISSRINYESVFPHATVGKMCDLIARLDETEVPALTDDFSVAVAFPFATLQGLQLMPDGGELHLSFMSGTHPIIEADLPDGFPFLYIEGGMINPFDENVDEILVNNAGAAAVRLVGRIGWNNP